MKLSSSIASVAIVLVAVAYVGHGNSEVLEGEPLTPEEKAVAGRAIAYIEKTIQNNLIRYYAATSGGNERKPRQDDDDDLLSVTPDPTVIPQVAQLLGVIFSGGLNLTRVVDQTYGLVPNILRNQVGGWVKLLTQGSTTPTPLAAAATSGPGSVVAQGSVNIPSSPAIIEAQKARKQNEQAGRSASDDEVIENNADDTVFFGDRQSRGFLDDVRNMFERIDVNMTEVAQAMPVIMNGTRTALGVLSKLGMLDYPNDVLDELGLPPLFEEDQ